MRNKEDKNSRKTHEAKSQIIKYTAKECKESMAKNN
jgi:hypothetical protein